MLRIMKIYNIFVPSFFKLSLRDESIFNTSSATCLFNLLFLEILCYITLHSLTYPARNFWNF